MESYFPRLARNGLALSVTRDFRERAPTRVSGVTSTRVIQLREEILGCTSRRDVYNLRWSIVSPEATMCFVDKQPSWALPTRVFSTPVEVVRSVCVVFAIPQRLLREFRHKHHPQLAPLAFCRAIGLLFLISSRRVAEMRPWTTTCQTLDHMTI